MKRFYLIAFFICQAFAVLQAQNKVTVTGKVIDGDDKSAVPQATVQLLALPDSTMAVGNVTNNAGFFSVAAKPGKYVLRISFVGYTTQDKPLQLTANKPTLNVGTVELATDAVMLKEAVVTAEAPQVTVKGDSLEYNASAYRTPEGAMLEELVKKLPGAEVDDDGNIKINGKEVKKIMVNGKEFFGGDVQTGMKNLPVDMVEKLKAYDKKSDLARITGIDDGEEETVLDLTVKKGMNQGVFGNVDLGGGPKTFQGKSDLIDRYTGRAMVNYFRDNSQLSFIGRANNVNDQGFFGGGGGPRFNRNNGLTSTQMFGLNFATKTNKLEMGGSARYNWTGNELISIGSVSNTVSAVNTFSNTNMNRNSDRYSFNADFRMEWTPDSLTNIIFRPNVSINKNKQRSQSVSSTFSADPLERSENPNEWVDIKKLIDEGMDEKDPFGDTRKNATESNNRTESHGTSANGTLQINRKLNNMGRNLTFRGRFNYSDNDNDQFSESNTFYFTNPGSPSLYTDIWQYNHQDIYRLVRNQYITTPTKSYGYMAQMTYSEPIARNTFLQFSYQFQYSYNKSDKRTYDLYKADPSWEIDDPVPSNYQDWKDADLSKYAEYKNFNHNAQVGLRFIRAKYQLSAGLMFRPQHSKLSYEKGSIKIDTTRNVFNFAPNIDFRYKFSNTSQLRFTYRGNSQQPSMENLLDIEDNSNPLNITRGNPGLKPSFTHSVQGFYNTYNAEKQRGIMTHLNFSATQNGISQKRVYNDATGGWITRPENINGNWNAFGMFGFNTALPNKKFTVNSFTTANLNNSVAYLTNGKDITAEAQKNTNTNTSLGERINFAYRNNWIDFGINGSINYTWERNKLVPDNNQEPYTFGYGFNTTLTAPWGMSFTTNLNNQGRRGYTDESMNKNELIWNVQLAQSFLKSRSLTLSIEAYDLLHQQSNISRTFSATTGRSIYTYNAVNSYIMVHVIYRLQIFGSKEARERMSQMRGGFGGRGFGGPGGGHPAAFGGRRF